MEKFEDAYRGKRVWMTGHTGFKGAWLCEWLLKLGAEVWGYSLPPVPAGGHREGDPLGGVDPYGSSKAAAEFAVASWRNACFPPLNQGGPGVAVASARAGNVIGGGDWAEDRIVPDAGRVFSEEDEPAIFDYLPDKAQAMLEEEPLRRLAAEGRLAADSHEGFWQPMDTYQEFALPNRLWESGAAPWLR